MATKTRRLADLLANIDDNSKVTSAGLLDATITAADLAANSVGESELAANVIPVKPHIRYGILQPAVAGKDLSGTALGGSYTYGTAHTDGHKYYYTDIKGSKPIKDPRIGAHFGSQRHEIASIQLLEQETATHGSDVYSIDGREWMRCTGGGWSWINDPHGSRLKGGNVSSYANMYIEVVGYFNGINTCAYTDENHKFRYALDGATEVATDYGAGAVGTPLGSRYVDPSSVTNIPISTTLGIHTIKLRNNGAEHDVHGIELIVQDTSSTANKSKIQIPAQNVVSYGKKFSIPATAQHYDPFNGFTNGTTLHSAVVDTATSLGLSSAPGSSASWAISGSNNIRPYNGGRVVKWVDSSGTIKTSVNMMPPNAQNIGPTASAEITTPSATNTAYLPAFSDDAIDHSQAEVAKTFHYREFGNGAANGGASSSYADASMFTTGGDNIAHVMDDGLTSFSGQDVRENGQLYHHDTTGIYLTWIGTGLSYHSNTGHGAPNATWAQNLPYGTHILKIEAYAAYGGTNGEDHKLTLDGVVIANPLTVTHADTGVPYLGHPEFTFHQPKMPPIPEDAVVISDYMLMADHVVRTADGADKISKGVRGLSSSRDVFYSGAGAFTISLDPDVPYGYTIYRDTESTLLSRITAFSTNAIKLSYNAAARYQAWYTNDTAHSGTAASTTKLGAGHGSYYHPTTATTLGQNIYDQFGAGVSAVQTQGYEIVSPIHTSSHYQTFETPFLHELVGGDRNMEQNNLVVTADGKSWDEVTRNTSYLSNMRFQAASGASDMNSTQVYFPDDVRGRQGTRDLGNKDFAIAYDRLICLVDGVYCVGIRGYSNALVSSEIKINGTLALQHNLGAGSGGQNFNPEVTVHLKRGDYIQWNSPYNGGHYGDWWVWKV